VTASALTHRAGEVKNLDDEFFPEVLEKQDPRTEDRDAIQAVY
jgi:hypothetical protein